MYQPSLHQSPVKEGRRILSEKNANACLSPARSPAKRTLFNAPSPSAKKLLPSPLFAPSFVSQKRSITQVDAEDAGSQLPESGSEQRVGIGHGSDAMNIDVSEQTRQQEGEQGDIATSRAVPSDPETRKQFIQEKASLLRSRLQNAMRRVRDPQFDRRLSELEEHSRKCPRLSAPATKPAGGVGLQQHLEQKYRTEGTGTRAQAKEDKDDNGDELVLSTPRAQVQREGQEQREIIQIPNEDDEETTPTQNKTVQRTDMQMNGNENRAPSPTQMVLSSPTYNSTAQAGQFDDDRPLEREATVATSPSSSVRGQGRGDGDAVDGLLKLMGTPTTGHGQGHEQTAGASV
ncbi:uncharacterized protein BDW70DRAFT_109564 [Aspergillus foveolatus]|uniref:uncharacterized protein n=1 Tax=Aspergillus foveolatus TaxID=210207 RepID=UPI003CCCB6D5